MKIILLQPPSPPYMNVKRDYAGGMGVADPSIRSTYGHDKEYIILPYMSLLYSAAILEKEGYEVSFVDGQTENLNEGQVLEQVKKIGPEVLISVVNLPSIYEDLNLLKIIKESFSVLKVVAIGTVTIPLYKLIAESGAVDVIIRGDAEAILPDLFKYEDKFEIQDGVLTNKYFGRIKDLDEYPDLPYHLVPIDDYWYHVFGKGVKYAPVFSSRGCSYRCYYCPYPMGFGDKIVYRNPVKVVDEIENLQKKHGIKAVLFRDQVFTMDWARTEKICDELIKRNLKIEWVIETRLDRVNEKLLRKMKQAGCKRIHYGLESGDPKLFSRVGKDQAEGRMEKLIRNFSLTEKMNIGAHMFILIGLLGENWQTIHNTIKAIKRIKPLTIQVAIVTPYPGTGLFNEAKQKGLLLNENWSQYTGFKPVLRTEELSGEELLKARNLIISEHKKAVFWKRKIHKARLFMRYIKDGSIYGRILLKMKFSKRAKSILCKILFRTQLIYVYRALVNKKLGNPVRILSMHRVIDGDEFKKRIFYLKRHYNFISLYDYIGYLKNGNSLSKNSVVLTFDDGFKDIFTSAYPCLKEEGVPFSIFVTTGFIGQNGVMLSWDEIDKMSKDSFVSWGVHSVNHRVLTELSLDEAEREIVDSKRELEKRLSRQIDIFCYPDGKYDESIKKILVKNGFIASCATGRKLNYGQVDIFGLKRIPFDSEPIERFALRVAGRT